MNRRRQAESAGLHAIGQKQKENRTPKKKSEEEMIMEKICFKTEKGPAAVGPYCTATICGGLIFMSGMIGVDPVTQKPVPGGTLAQAGQVFQNIVTVLGELGATVEDVLKTTVYLTDIGDFAEVNRLYADVFGPDFPARTCVEVSRLPMGLSIEVECIARARE